MDKKILEEITEKHQNADSLICLVFSGFDIFGLILKIFV